MRAAGFPERLELSDRLLVRAGQRREDGPAPVEQLGEARFRAGIFGAGDRVAGDEVDAFGHMRADVADHGGFHRARVGEDRAGCEVGCDFRRERAEGANRRAQDDKVRALDGIGGVLVNLIGKAEPGVRWRA